MESKLSDQLKKLSKDDSSYRELKKIFEQLDQERRIHQKNMRLLEAAIRNDCESILITELELEKPGPRIVYVNDGFSAMTGYTREEVIGNTPRLLQGPKTDRTTLDKLKERLQNGQSFFGRAVNYRKDGTEFINQWDIHPLEDEKGNITHWVSYQHDVTERKKAERFLMDTRVEFEDLREELDRTLVDMDMEGNIVQANKAFRELTGYQTEELTSIKIWDLFPQKFKSSLKSRFESETSGEKFRGWDFKGILTHKSGVPVQVEGKTKIMDFRDQTVIRADIRNISLQKRVMETLKKRNRDYQNIIDKASDF